VIARVRPSIRRTARIVLPILIVVGAWQIWDNVETRRLESAYTRVRPRVSKAKPIGNSSAAVADSAGRFYDAAAVAVRDSGSYGPQETLLAVLVRAREALRSGRELSPEDRTRADAFLARNDLALQLVDRGASLPYEVYRGSGFNERVSGTWTAERVTALATLAALRRRDGAAAARSLNSRVQLVRALSPDTFSSLLKAGAVLNQATDIAMLLAVPGVSDADLQILDTHLAQTYRDDELRRLIAGYAQASYDFVSAASGANSWQYGHLGVPLHPLLAHRLTATMETSAEAIEMAGRPWPERIMEMKTLQDHSTIVGNVFLSYPWWQVAEIAKEAVAYLGRGLTATRAARVAIAVEEYRRRTGALPTSLAALGIDRDTTIDPFSGAPLEYTVTASGFQVYSVGDNGRDDGGAIEEVLRKGASPGRGERPDIGVRVEYRQQGR
jgi:hypothetical protein